jgi:hemolysin D
MIFLVVALLWASIGRVDIVTVARGKVVPAGKSKVIQPLEAGKIAAINVEEGRRVNKGDLLVQLDPNDAQADVKRLAAMRDHAANEIERVDRLLHWVRQKDSQAFNVSAETDSLLYSQWREYRSRLETLEARRQEIESRAETAKSQLAKIEALLPIVERRAANERSLLAKKMFAEQDYLETEQIRVGMVHDVEIERRRVGEFEQAARAVDVEMAYAKDEFRQALSARREKASQALVSAEQELIKAKQREASHLLHAPVDGVVHQLAVHTVGGVVAPAQTLMTIVPAEAKLEVEAFVKNKDVGFVSTGQQVELKFDAFPFTRYGTIRGEVIDLSDDAIADDTAGLVYRASVAMFSDSIDVDGKTVPLTPGMSVATEVKTGSRRLIEFLMSPIIRAVKESARER